MKYANVIEAVSLLMLAACSSFNEIDLDEKTEDEGDLVERVIFDVPVIRSLGDDDETRASLSQEGEGDVIFSWEATDTIGIYPNKGSQVYFEMADGVGTSAASFDGGGWALRSGFTYSCYYPFVCDMKLKRDAIPVSFVNQEQKGVSNYEGVRFYLASEGTSSSSGTLRFAVQMLNTVIRIKAIGLPAGTYTKVSLTADEDVFVQEGTFGLDDMVIRGKTYSNTLEVKLNDFTLTEASTEANPAMIYFTSAPVDLSGKTVTVRMYSSDGSVYKCEKTPSKAYEAGAWGGLKCVMEEDTGSICFKDPEVKRICVENWDSNGDGELDKEEAAAVTNLRYVFRNSNISSFEELQFFVGLTRIGNYAFAGCSSLTGDLYIPDNVTSIGDYAFDDCHGFTGSLTLPNGLTSIGSYAFSNCYGFTGDLTIPGSVTSIGDYAFGSCFGLTGSLTLSDGLTSIGSGAFDVCSGITGGLTIPGSVTSIGDYAFDGCSSLTGDLTITGSVTSIGDYAFRDCHGFTGSLTLPDGLTSIGNGAFCDCYGFTGDLAIPDSVASIGYDAFRDCSGLTSISIRVRIPPVGRPGMFDYTDDCPINVPAVSVETYKTAEYWSDYADRIQAIPSTTGFINGHAYVDMGNGLKWATMNIGANGPEEYGDYYAWGETLSKQDYSEATYNYSSGFMDTATARWGDGWRMPTEDEWNTLITSCTWNKAFKEVDGTRVFTGYNVVASNGNTIHLPAAGDCGGTLIYDSGVRGHYWSSSRDPNYSDCARDVLFSEDGISTGIQGRFIGQSIRPVSD